MMMDGVIFKLPSFNFLAPNSSAAARSPVIIRCGLPRFSSSSSSSSSSTAIPAIATGEPALGSLSLGHITRPDFPILHQEVNGSKLVYLDNAATSQKPNSVLKALQNYYETYNSNVHRGIHYLSAKATDEYELARKKVAAFVNASDSSEIVFTRNATEAINLVAYSWGLANLKPGDEIIVTIAEHHSAIVPWQLIAQRTGALLKFVSLNQNEVPDVQQLKEMITRNTKLVAVHHISNVLGGFICFLLAFFIVTLF